MSRHYDDIAFTEAVSHVQERYGSRSFYDRRNARRRRGDGRERGDALSQDEREYLGERDSFYLATVSATGWPYVQFRGGPPGFLRVVDDHTLGWADFRGNLQYISTGNLADNDRVALIVMDYPNRQRLKIYGHARVASVEEEPGLVAKLTLPDYDAVVQRAVVVSVAAFDWNCQQHITPRYTVAELGAPLAAMRQRIRDLEVENAELTAADPAAATSAPGDSPGAGGARPAPGSFPGNPTVSRPPERQG
jgi:hypothetical protein